MLILDKDEFLQVLEDNDYTAFDVYDGHLSENAIKDKMTIEKFCKVDATKEECSKRINTFIDRRSGKYTFVLKIKPQIPTKNCSKIYVDTNTQYTIQTAEEVQRNIDVISQDLDPEQFNKLVEQRVNAILIEKETQREIEEKEKKLKELETNAGKLAFVANKIFENLINPKTILMQGTQEETQDEVFEVSKTEIAKACNKLVKTLGAQTIINLSNKLENPENASLILLVKDFANK